MFRRFNQSSQTSVGLEMLRKVFLALSVLLLIVPGIRIFGQSGATGTILGTITDSSGAVMPNVKVTVTNTATNANFTTVSGSSGDYTVPELKPGAYTVSATASGFQTSLTQSFVLAVDQTMSRRYGAEAWRSDGYGGCNRAGCATGHRQCCAFAELSGQQRSPKLSADGRNFVQLLFIGAGAVTIGGEQGTMRQGEGNAISINGGRPEGNNFTLDGWSIPTRLWRRRP